jgi:hypothetical protein
MNRSVRTDTDRPLSHPYTAPAATATRESPALAQCQLGAVLCAEQCAPAVAAAASAVKVQAACKDRSGYRSRDSADAVVGLRG